MPELEISKVHDAYAAAPECPLCELREAAEKAYLRSFQHSRVMEPNVRVRTNEEGFCPDHYRKLYAGENKLGLGLVVHTHLAERLPGMRAGFEAIRRAAGTRNAKERVAAAAAELAGLRDRCFICGLLGVDMARYAFTILYLWKKDAGFPDTLRASRGFCVPHFLDMLDEAVRSMRGDALERWLDDVLPLMRQSLEALETDLLAFTQLHQAGSPGMGTEETRSALGRTLQKLAGGIFRAG